MGVFDTTNPLPPLKSFSLTHILYDPTRPLSIPFSLLSLSPIFLFVAYATLLIFARRLTVLSLLIGQLSNELFNLVLKRTWKGERPYFGSGEVGDGYGMPSSHSQFAGFLFVWGLGYWMTSGRRYGIDNTGSDRGGALEVIRIWRARVYVLGLGLWSVLVAYSRYHLHYHSPLQIATGYLIGMTVGLIYFLVTEYIPLYNPTSSLGSIRKDVERVWEGIGGIGGNELGAASGGWGEGRYLLNRVGSEVNIDRQSGKSRSNGTRTKKS